MERVRPSEAITKAEFHMLGGGGATDDRSGMAGGH
jgi:hypothetical protein